MTRMKHYGTGAYLDRLLFAFISFSGYLLLISDSFSKVFPCCSIKKCCVYFLFV